MSRLIAPEQFLQGLSHLSLIHDEKLVDRDLLARLHAEELDDARAGIREGPERAGTEAGHEDVARIVQPDRARSTRERPCS